MNIYPNELNQPMIGVPGFGSSQPQPFPNAFQPPAALSPQHQALLRALASQMAANPSLGASAPAPAAHPPQPAKPAPAPPRYQVVKHPSAPARLPYAIKDNHTGGYVTGGSPLFPRVFSTAAEAKAAIPATPAVKTAPTPETTAPASSAAPRFQVKINPDAPARLRYGVYDSHAGDWMRNKFGFAQAYGTLSEARENMPAQPASEKLSVSQGNGRIPETQNLTPRPSMGLMHPLFLDGHSATWLGASTPSHRFLSFDESKQSRWNQLMSDLSQLLHRSAPSVLSAQARPEPKHAQKTAEAAHPAPRSQATQTQPPAPVNLYSMDDIAGTTPADPNSKQGIVVFVPGTNSNYKTFTPDFVNGVDKVYRPQANYFFNWDASGVGTGTSSAAVSDIKGNASEKLAEEIQALKDKYPGVPVLVIAHSNGGNVAVEAENDYPGLTDLIIRFGSPDMGTLDSLDRNSRSSVIDLYDPEDTVDFTKVSSLSAGNQGLVPNQKNWHRIKVTAPETGSVLVPRGFRKHLNMHSLDVWDQIQGDLLYYGKLKQFGGRADLINLR